MNRWWYSGYTDNWGAGVEPKAGVSSLTRGGIELW